jgi:hypothetical protein
LLKLSDILNKKLMKKCCDIKVNSYIAHQIYYLLLV